MFETIGNEVSIKKEPCEENIEIEPFDNPKVITENNTDNLYEICNIKVEPIIKQIAANSSLPFYSNIEVKIEHEVLESSNSLTSLVNLTSRKKIIFEDSLYDNHTIKEELVVGPEIVQERNNLIPHEQNDINDNKSSTCSLNNHEKLQCGPCSEKFNCEHCKKTFCSKSKIIHHLKTNHGQIFDKKNDSTINVKNNVCDKCGKCYAKKNYLANHVKIVHEGKKPYPCNKCRNSYTGKLELQYHYLIFHSSPDNSKRNKQFKYCQYCDRPFTRKSHCDLHEMYRCAKNKNRKQINKIKVTVPKKYTCDICDKEYTYKCSLNAHVRCHLGTRNIYQCDVCDKKYTKKSNLKNHILSKHMNLRSFSCDECEITFTSLWAKKYHKQNQCPRKFECRICRKHFKYSKNLKKHLRKYHTNSSYSQ